MADRPGYKNIKGTDYKLVAQRVKEFREKFPKYGKLTTVIHQDEKRVLVQVDITDETGRIIGSGIAEEDRTATRINEQSAVECCDTSAYGRALASMGYAGNDAYASAEEVANAIQNDTPKKIVDHNMAVKENMHEIYEMKVCMAKEDYDLAAGYWYDLGEEVRAALHLAPTKGGIWETNEFPMLKADGVVGRAMTQIIKNKQTEKAA